MVECQHFSFSFDDNPCTYDGHHCRNIAIVLQNAMNRTCFLFSALMQTEHLFDAARLRAYVFCKRMSSSLLLLQER